MRPLIRSIERKAFGSEMVFKPDVVDFSEVHCMCLRVHARLCWVLGLRKKLVMVLGMFWGRGKERVRVCWAGRGEGGSCREAKRHAARDRSEAM